MLKQGQMDFLRVAQDLPEIHNEWLTVKPKQTATFRFGSVKSQRFSLYVDNFRLVTVRMIGSFHLLN